MEDGVGIESETTAKTACLPGRRGSESCASWRKAPKPPAASTARCRWGPRPRWMTRRGLPAKRHRWNGHRQRIRPHQTDNRLPFDLDHSGQIDRLILDLYDLYDLAHVAGWEPHNLHNLGHVSWVRAVLLYRWSCTVCHSSRLRMETPHDYGHIRRFHGRTKSSSKQATQLQKLKSHENWPVNTKT